MADIISTIESLVGKKVEGQNPLIPLWESFYSGNYKELNYRITTSVGKKRKMRKKTLNFPKKLSEDFANFMMNEQVEIVVDENAKEQVEKFLKDINFWSRANKNLEQAMALSIGAWVEGIKGIEVDEENNIIKKGVLNVRFVNANKIYPITVIDGEIVECAFATKNTNFTAIEMHLLDEQGNYVVKICKVDNNNHTVVGEIQEFKTLSNIPLFQLVYPNIVNNIDINSHLPISVYANQLDKFRCLDEKYDDFDIEFRNGKKRIFVNSELWKVDTESGSIVRSFDENDTVFYELQFQDNSKPMITSSSDPLRELSYINAINSELGLISLGVGLGTDLYNFSSQGRPIQTATGVMAKNSEAIRTIKKHEKVVKDAIIGFIKAIAYLSNNFTDDPFGEIKTINVLFDDTFFEDKDSEQTRDRNNVSAGLMSEVEYRMRWFGETEEAAKEYVYKNLRYKLINNNLQALTSGALPVKEFVEICYGDKDENTKNEYQIFITESLEKSAVPDFNLMETE